MILKNEVVFIVGTLALFASIDVVAECQCTDVSGIVDRALQERVIRVAQRESGAYRGDLKMESVMYCAGELVFRGVIADKRKFEVKIDAADWKELRATISSSKK